MKKQLLIIPAIALLAACGGGNNQSQSGGISSKTPTAYQIFKLIDPKNASIELSNDTDTTATDKFCYSYESEQGSEREIVSCLSHSDGSTLVIYQDFLYSEDDYGNFPKQFKLYLYQDGKLTERDDLMPNPSQNDYVAADAVSFYNVDVNDYAYIEFDTEDAPKMLKFNKWAIEGDPIKLLYKWDGTKFVATDNDHQPKQNVITTAGLGRIFIGSNPPESLDGFQKNTLGKTVFFNRDGKKQFKLSLNNEDKIDTITILTDHYTYRMYFDDAPNGHYGIGINNVGYGLKGQYFVMKDGVWVRTIDETNDDNISDMFGETSRNPIDYPHSGVIEFYTTKDAIKNITPENGKKVTAADHPEFNDDATVTLIKIYRQQADANKKYDDEEETQNNGEINSAEAETLLRNLYTKFVFVLGDENCDEEDALDNYCTKKMIKYLYDSYCYDGEGIAIWEFNGSEQRELYQVNFVKAEPLGNGIFRVRYTNDNGRINDSCDVKLVIENSKLLVDEIIQMN